MLPCTGTLIESTTSGQSSHRAPQAHHRVPEDLAREEGPRVAVHGEAVALPEVEPTGEAQDALRQDLAPHAEGPRDVDAAAELGAVVAVDYHCLLRVLHKQTEGPCRLNARKLLHCMAWQRMCPADMTHVEVTRVARVQENSQVFFQKVFPQFWGCPKLVLVGACRSRHETLVNVKEAHLLVLLLHVPKCLLHLIHRSLLPPLRPVIRAAIHSSRSLPGPAKCNTLVHGIRQLLHGAENLLEGCISLWVGIFVGVHQQG
mmetsp:Transcript_30984/g.62502  ORF Transcript_30984/g.62502 Transcript_30984/m.62502 type:complete len:259 (-) Transcript_30984:545-1321(-)